MAKPKLFIGSSQKNLRVAGVLAEALEESAQVRVWNEGVFGLNQGFLETLLKQLEEYDFAAFVLASDDLTTSADQSRPSPRDNVLFESGLFMGVLGRDRVFLVYDDAVRLKIPSDLAGLTLASYDGSRMVNEPQAAVRAACRKISDAITASRYPHLIGDWKSVYPLTFEDGCPMVDEVLEVRPGRNGLIFATKTSSLNDFYTASGHLTLDRQIDGPVEVSRGHERHGGRIPADDLSHLRPDVWLLHDTRCRGLGGVRHVGHGEDDRCRRGNGHRADQERTRSPRAGDVLAADAAGPERLNPAELAAAVHPNLRAAHPPEFQWESPKPLPGSRSDVS